MVDVLATSSGVNSRRQGLTGSSSKLSAGSASSRSTSIAHSRRDGWTAFRGDEIVDGLELDALAGTLLVGAVATVLEATVVTRTVNDSERFDGVPVES